jgi:hypothetical protein
MGLFIFLSIHYLLDPNIYRNILQESLTTALGREVSMGQARIILLRGVGISFEDFRLKDRSLPFDLLQSKRLILKVKLLPLFRGEVKWKRIVLEKPVLHLHRDREGRFSFFDGPLSAEGFKVSQQKILHTLSTLFGGTLSIGNGEILFSDESLGPSSLNLEIHSFNLKFSKISYRNPFPFSLNGKINHSNKEGHFSIVGRIKDIPEDMDLSKGKVEARVEADGIDVFHFWPYLKKWLPMKTVSGTLELNANYQGDFTGAFKASADIKLKEVVFDYPKVFAYVLTPKWMNISFDVNYDMKDLKVPQISVELPEIRVKGKGKIYEIGTGGMGLEAEAESGPFDLSEGRKLIPYRIITPDVSDALFRAEGNGLVQILSVKLSGKIPEVEHCDQLLYAHTLSVEMRMDGARLKLPWDLPALEDLKGLLLFKNGHLNLSEVEGKALHSSIHQANGTFYRLLLVPTLQVDCEGKFDLKDLPSLMKIEGLTGELTEALLPIASLSGKADYRLSLKGDLKPPLHFQHQGSYHLSKVRFIHRRIPFPILIGNGMIEFSNQGFQWSEAKVEFGSSSLLMNGLWKREEKVHPLQIMAKGRIDLKNLFDLSQSSLFPEEARSKLKGIEGLSGMGQCSFKGKTIKKDVQLFSYEGEFIPKEANLLLKGVPHPIIFKEGFFSFSNLGVGFSKMKVQSGDSSLTLDGFVKEGNLSLISSGLVDLKQLRTLLQSPHAPEEIRSQIDEIQELTGKAEVRLRWLGRMEEGITSMKEGEIRLRGVSIQHQKIPVPLSQIEGSFLLSPGKMRFNGLKGMIGNSPLTVSGSMSRISSEPRNIRTDSSSSSTKAGSEGSSTVSRRRLSFQISSPQLDLDPLFLKGEKNTPTSFIKLSDWLSNWNIDGKIEVNQGKYRSLYYQDLRGEMKTVDGKLFFHPVQFKGAGGDLWGEGWIQPAEKGVRFEMKPRISNMEAKAFLRTIFRKGEEEKIELTGRFHIDKVELRGEGENFQKVKESLNGSLRVEMENGVIERFNILAKIFSILNVSQLFMGRFPDLNTKGLPYHQLMGTIHVKDGIASTEDFILESDAMRITLLGKVDVAKGLIDAKIGIHPLVTLDKILSYVPIAGYILTGKEKAFLSYVYEVKGDLNDPKIEPIPIKGLGESFLGIMKRLVETPLTPFKKTPSSDKKDGN